MLPPAFVKLLGQAHVHLYEGRMAAARDCFYQALRIGPANAGLLQLLGTTCFECDQLDEAFAYARAVLALNPADVTAHMQLAMMLLLLGEAEIGWQEYAWRAHLAKPKLPAIPAEIPPWTGDPLGDRPILLMCEQGYGDVIQMARYASLLTAGGQRVVQDVPPPLRRLFAAQPGFGTILQSDVRERVSTFAFVMDLPRLFRHSPQGPGGQAPYMTEAQLRVQQQANSPQGPGGQAPYIAVPAAQAAQRFGPREPGMLRVGIAWAGSGKHGRDRFRSCPLPQWEPVLRTPHCRFFSLLTRDRDADLAKLSEPQRVTSLAPRIEDFHDLALAIETMDLVICVDTAVGHLAGAMGKPVWTLLCTPPDWRWGRAGESTGWYPTMRLFRQPQPGNWAAVMERVAAELAESPLL